MEEKDTGAKNDLKTSAPLEKVDRNTDLGEKGKKEGDDNTVNTKFLWDIHMETFTSQLKVQARERSRGGRGS